MARTFSPAEYIGSLEASIRAPESSAPAIGCALVEAGTNQLGWTASAVALDSAVIHKTGDTMSGSLIAPASSKFGETGTGRTTFIGDWSNGVSMFSQAFANRNAGFYIDSQYGYDGYAYTSQSVLSSRSDSDIAFSWRSSTGINARHLSVAGSGYVGFGTSSVYTGAGSATTKLKQVSAGALGVYLADETTLGTMRALSFASDNFGSASGGAAYYGGSVEGLRIGGSQYSPQGNFAGAQAGNAFLYAYNSTNNNYGGNIDLAWGRHGANTLGIYTNTSKAAFGNLQAGAITLSGSTPALRINQVGGDPNYNMFEVTANGKNLLKVDAIGYGGDTAYIKFGSTYGLLFQPAYAVGQLNSFTASAPIGFNAGGQRMTFGYYYNEYPGVHVFNGPGAGDGSITAGAITASGPITRQRPSGTYNNIIRWPTVYSGTTDAFIDQYGGRLENNPTNAQNGTALPANTTHLTLGAGGAAFALSAADYGGVFMVNPDGKFQTSASAFKFRNWADNADHPIQVGTITSTSSAATPFLVTSSQAGGYALAELRPVGGAGSSMVIGVAGSAYQISGQGNLPLQLQTSNTTRLTISGNSPTLTFPSAGTVVFSTASTPTITATDDFINFALYSRIGTRIGYSGINVNTTSNAAAAGIFEPSNDAYAAMILQPKSVNQATPLLLINSISGERKFTVSHLGDMVAVGAVSQAYIYAASPSFRSTMTAAGARKSEVYSSALSTWQTTIREEADAGGAKLAIYGKTPIAQQTAPSVATDLASAITAVNTHTTSLTSFGLYA